MLQPRNVTNQDDGINDNNIPITNRSAKNVVADDSIAS